jgi:hypothetical protein
MPRALPDRGQAVRDARLSTTLYRNPTIRAIIEVHRHRSARGGTLTGLTDEFATPRTVVNELAARVR